MQNDERGQENDQGELVHVGEEAGHFDAVFLGDRFDHKVWAVTDVRHAAEENGADADRTKQRFGDSCDERAAGNAESHSKRMEGDRGRCVIEKTAQEPGGIVELECLGDTERLCVGFEEEEARHHSDENAEEKIGDFLDRAPGKVVGLSCFI